MAPSPKSILFVDDEPAVLSLLQAVFRRFGQDWEASGAESGASALALLEEKPFDVVVSDMRMPAMNGAEFLAEVMKRQPRTARIILSGYADQQLVLRSLGATHQFLTKPCDIQLLRSTIQRLVALQGWVSGDQFKAISSSIHTLPSLPSLYFKLMDELGSPNATTDTVGDLIAQDVALTAKLLQLVNSAFFGVARQVASAHEAVQILGFSMVRTLALSIFVFSRFDPSRMPDFPMERLWKHSMSTGLQARRIAASEHCDSTTIETAFTAGILHDIGKLVLGYGLSDLYRQAVDTAVKSSRPQHLVEREVLGVTHAEVGAYLLGLWGLPAGIVEAVAWHHQPQQREPKEVCALTAVHVADHIQSVQTPCHDPPLRSPLDREYLQGLDVIQKLPSWEDVGLGA